MEGESDFLPCEGPKGCYSFAKRLAHPEGIAFLLGEILPFRTVRLLESYPICK
jgi:hypothetical protein